MNLSLQEDLITIYTLEAVFLFQETFVSEHKMYSLERPSAVKEIGRN